ncbi:3-hydroxyacyl-CoA dehydrogenase/enoyl-CoA hydratase family protein [Synechococcus sp. PCC 7336]|uniref:3-hydroxyacyl-CoA dehydrogenase/enoyl-CoA hydratase family protein n=1 Tax=Synechococcus sp. PCC 7336 TaxID=195250 RepID=UPI00034B2D48|nr:3-hydroxyacyl-CoA dehydrogenase/enoyl-CoA hydratase family protein [Synechococcus sp. PCC 7336]
MFRPFRTAAVLGAGVMGSQIAAHLANAGLTVHLLDLPSDRGSKNARTEMALKKGQKQSPPIFFSETVARRVLAGNFEDDFHRLSGVDWVIEAVVENLPVKQELMERIEAVVGEDAIISTNTSGLPVSEIARGRSPSFRRRFLGTHFFNPPRYLKLLELIPTTETDPQVLERVQWFGRMHLGKGVVVAKDTPNFIANRIGVFATMLALKWWLDEGYTIEEIDTLTGTLVGRPKSATFRTADLVGLDTLLYVTDHLYEAIPHDESRKLLLAPEVMRKLVATGSLGAKTGQGFYKKVDRQILSLNPDSLEYELPRPLDLDLEAIAKLPLNDRLPDLYADPGRAGAFFRQTSLEILAYAASRIPEIANSPIEIDRALRWGFGWQLGPFQTWDALGFSKVLEDMKAANLTVPDWVEQMELSGLTEFYNRVEEGSAEVLWVYVPETGYAPVDITPDELDLDDLKADPAKTLWSNPEAALLDIGDGVLLYEFRSKGNTLTDKVVRGLNEVLDFLESASYSGLVIGNDGPNFSAGANLQEMAGTAQQGGADAVAQMLAQFQGLMQRLRYFPKPIVAAMRGRALGGGCELVMACPHVVAAAESYIGLVELSVGLVPAGGGMLRMVSRAVDRAASESPSHIQPWLKAAFETIATAKVSNSAAEAIALGYLPADTVVVMNGDRLLYVAKQEVMRLEREGYAPPPDNVLMLLGSSARAVLEHMAYTMVEGGYASEYDRALAHRLAYAMTGGELTVPSLVPEQYLLDLERQAFVPLLAEAKTQERMAYLLKHKKPLRN